MGRESRVRKGRRCQHCHQLVYKTTHEHEDHTALCKRAIEAGLILPQPILPDLMAGPDRIVMP